ncbi:MAG: threonine/serine exporter family protein [Ruminococcaceae bacterium]|nr:threonine/serine exporter family protein [Oscillospiraceae bacterium]
MDYNTLLDLSTDLGYELAMCGAETFRIEESISRILSAYGIQAEVFAIPNCLTVSIETADGKPMTRMRRIGYHGNDIDGVERLAGLSRKICSQKPDPVQAKIELEQLCRNKRIYPLPIYLLGSFLGAFGFAMVFGGSIIDGFCGGFCGLIVGLINHYMNRMMANQFFRTIAASFPMALVAYAMSAVGIADNPDMVTIGALMILVPGLLFTNAMRDIIFGDTNSGTNRIVQVLLIAAAIALGTAAAWNTATALWGTPVSGESNIGILASLIPCFIGCLGFCILFNIHGFGVGMCALGGVLTWLVYCLTIHFGCSDLTGYFWATLFSAAYSETMARIRKCPAIGYLVVAIFPLIPGAGVYYTMRYAVMGEMDMFASQGMHTAAIAGIMAVAILLVSTTVRIWTLWQRNKK